MGSRPLGACCQERLQGARTHGPGGREAQVSPCPGLANIGYCQLGFLLMEGATCCLESPFKMRWSEVSPASIWGNPISAWNRPRKGQRQLRDWQVPRPACAHGWLLNAARTVYPIEDTSMIAEKYRPQLEELTFIESSKEKEGPVFPCKTENRFPGTFLLCLPQ